MNGKSVITPKPETEEYNVRNFVYKRRRPFHPERLWRLVYDKFILQLEHPGDNDENDSPEEPSNKTIEEVHVNGSGEEADDGGWEDVNTDMIDASISITYQSSASSDSSTAETPHGPSRRRSTIDTVATSIHMDVDEASKDDLTDADLTTPPKEVVLSNKRAHPLFSQLFRSKGTYWLATRPDYRGVWSQAGAMLTLVGGPRWDCTLSPEEISHLYPDGTDRELLEQVKHDVETGGEWGDRMQEIVFIGEMLDVDGIEGLLDTCLLSDEEWEVWQGGMRTVKERQAALKRVMEELDAAKDKLTEGFADAFPDWEGHFQDEDGGDEEDDEDGHDGH